MTRSGDVSAYIECCGVYVASMQPIQLAFGTGCPSLLCTPQNAPHYVSPFGCAPHLKDGGFLLVYDDDCTAPYFRAPVPPYKSASPHPRDDLCLSLFNFESAPFRKIDFTKTIRTRKTCHLSRTSKPIEERRKVYTGTRIWLRK
jgi:hypothetical protein